jgi:hypothetical protein
MTAPRSATVWQVRAALAAMILWAAAMLYLVLTSANPPIVSRPQVLSADAVVEGVLEVGVSTLLKPDVVTWSRRPLELSDLPKDGILVTDQKASWMKSGARAIAPIAEVAPGRFHVQPIPFEVESPRWGPETGPAPIYPATNVVKRQLEPLMPKENMP